MPKQSSGKHYSIKERSVKWKKAWIAARKKFPNNLNLQRAFVVDNWEKY